MRANLAFTDDIYTQMLFVIDLLCKDNGRESTGLLLFFFNGKNSTNIRETETRDWGEEMSVKEARSPSQEAFKQRVEKPLIRGVVEAISLRP